MAGYRHFSEMPVWEKAHAVVLLVYGVTGGFPEMERFGLTSQMRRAAVSITSNIAEGFGRQTSRDKARFYLHARGSSYEVQSQIYVARDVKYLPTQESADLCNRLDSIIHDLNKIIKTLSTRAQPKP